MYLKDQIISGNKIKPNQTRALDTITKEEICYWKTQLREMSGKEGSCFPCSGLNQCSNYIGIPISEAIEYLNNI